MSERDQIRAIIDELWTDAKRTQTQPGFDQAAKGVAIVSIEKLLLEAQLGRNGGA